jgi:TRAP-type C4-dicarboxylate transport system substrate-binding protein
MLKTIKKYGVGLSLIAGLECSAVVNAETTMVVGTWLPPTSVQNSVVWPTWAKWVEEATEGRVKVKIEYDVGHPKSYFQLVEDGVIDAGFSYHGYVPGRFRLPMVAEQPGMGVGAEAAFGVYSKNTFSLQMSSRGLRWWGCSLTGRAS